MKTKLLLSLILLATLNIVSFAQQQIPQGFSYQAIARDAANTLLSNKALTVRLSIQNSLTTGTVRWQETHSVTTDNFGVFNLVIGSGTRTAGTATLFSDINWSAENLFIKIELNQGSGFVTMGTTKLNSVPYAMVAEEAIGMASGSKLSVVSDNDADPEALFEVKRSDGQTVFAVYPDAVNIYVPRSGKGNKGGFAIGGFEQAKASPQDYFRVTPDSVRVYIDPTPAASKGSKGGFAIGGFSETKGGINDMYFNLSGASAVNLVPTESPQILWYPIKKAFLAGSVHIGAVDSVGQNSTALGYRSIAMGNFSQAFGYRARAFGDFSTSIGKNSVAGVRVSGVSTASNAFAFGDQAKALGPNSIAFGTGTQATVSNSLAVGNGSIASGTNSTAMGYQSQAQGDKSIAIGSYYSLSYPIPKLTIAKKGSDLPTDGSKGIDVFLPIRPITTYTVLSRVYNRANIASGQYSVAVGNGNLAQSGGFVFGSNSDALLFGALALGNSAHANETNSIAAGYETIANGMYSVAIGNNVTAPSYGEIALGQWNEAIAGTKDTWNENQLLFSLGNGTSSTDRSNAVTIYKDGKTNIMGKYASTTFNYKYARTFFTGTFPNLTLTTKDYVYGIYTNINRDDPNIEYYYSGYFKATGTNGTYYGEYADQRSGGAIDVAEYIYDSNNNTTAADVVVADVNNKESVVKSSKPYQNGVVGVISTKPHMTMGMELVINEETGEPLKDAKPATRLALTGRVPVNVCGENGPIKPGDLLTTSSTAGTAMKWSLLDVNTAKDFDELKKMISENERRSTAIIGVAVDSFSGSGTGKVVVLISLN